MPARSPNKIYQSFVANEGREAKLRRKLVANKEQNWLLAIMLNSFQKYSTGASLTDLEQTIVDKFREHGFTGDQLKEQGGFFAVMSPDLRKEMFPGKFASFSQQTNYTMADLEQDAPGIAQSFLSMPNVRKIDVQAIHEGTAHLNDFPPVPKEVRKFHGAATFFARLPSAAPPPIDPQYTIKAGTFRCNEETGWDWTGSDEPYWIFASMGAGVSVTTRSHVFEDVDTGDVCSFDQGEGCIWGHDCSPNDFPDGEIAALISLWEHDGGNPDDVANGIGAAFAVAGGVLIAAGVTAWVGAVVAGVGAAVKWLVSFLDDDHIADQTYVFDRATVEAQFQKPQQTDFDISLNFADGDGDYTLWIKVARTS